MRPERAEFERTVRDHHAAVYRSALRITRNADDAEDVTQQVFLRVLEGRLSLEDAESPEKVLCWMAAKTALAQLRGAHNRREKETMRAMKNENTEPNAPKETAEAREASGAVRRLLHKLPGDLRHALVLRFQEGMTYDAMGEALSCSEPTAHNRVKRGLDKLRVDLSRAGFSGMAVGLPSLLAEEELATVPMKLEASLLALEAAALAKASSLGIVAGAAAVVLLVGGAWIGVKALVGGDEPGRAESSGIAVVHESGTTPVADTERNDSGGDPSVETFESREALTASFGSSAGSLDADVAPSGTVGFLEGVALDGDGLVLEGVSIEASSFARSGKFAMFAANGLSDENGRFRLELPIASGASDRGQRYRVLAKKPGHRNDAVESVNVRTGETARLEALTLAAVVNDRPGEFSLTVHVTDESGSPVKDAQVTVSRVSEDPIRFPYNEIRTSTDGLGQVTLTGKRVGEKRVAVRAHEQGYLEWMETAVVDEGTNELQIVLARGGTIAGRARHVSGVIPEGLELVARSEAKDEIHAVADADGRFRFEGLGEGPYTIENFRVSVYIGDSPTPATRCSPFLMRNVDVGREDVEIIIKEKEDSADHGTHLAELHGIVRDAETREEIRIETWDIWVKRVPDLSTDVLEREVLPGVLAPFMGQVMAAPDDRIRADFHEVGLEAGTYYVVVHQRDYATGIAGPLRLEADEIMNDLVIELHRGAVIEGVVRDPSGKPVAGAFVGYAGFGEAAERDVAERDARVIETSGQGYHHFWPWRKTDEEGRYTFTHVPARIAPRMTVVHPDFEPAIGTGAIELVEGGTRSGVDLTLGPRR